MTFLLDVNVVIALIDTRHIDHTAAVDWFDREAINDWATCPIVENGVVRIVGNPNYANSPSNPPLVAELLKELTGLPGHSFWADDLSLVRDRLIDPKRILTPKQITDTYLLALAVRNGGRFATFDRRLSTSAVTNGRDALFLV